MPYYNNKICIFLFYIVDERFKVVDVLLYALQVQEKLSASEYEEFVNLMKAFKSKAMNLTEVLGSIARLFSGPERFSLLKRYHVIVQMIAAPTVVDLEF